MSTLTRKYHVLSQFLYSDTKDVKSANLIMNRRHKYHVDRITNTSATLIEDPRHKCHVDHEPRNKCHVDYKPTS